MTEQSKQTTGALSIPDIKLNNTLQDLTFDDLKECIDPIPAVKGKATKDVFNAALESARALEQKKDPNNSHWTAAFKGVVQPMKAKKDLMSAAAQSITQKFGTPEESAIGKSFAAMNSSETKRASEMKKERLAEEERVAQISQITSALNRQTKKLSL